MNEDATQQWVAGRLRQARRERDMTLAVAAAQIGISGAYLSRLEKGDRQPSIGVLFEVARVYQISIGDLLGEPPRTDYHLTRRSESVPMPGPDGLYAPLSGLGSSAALKAVRLRLPDANTERPAPQDSSHQPAQHAGEELIYVVAGELDVTLADEPLHLHEGDSLHFDAQTPHRLTNPGPGTAEVVIISTSTSTSTSTSAATSPHGTTVQR
jgi:transcriptional regulator with XRE-family HTH domain